MSKSESRQRNKWLKARCNDEEAELIRRKAEAAGIGVSDLLRRSALNRKIVTRTDQRLMNELLPRRLAKALVQPDAGQHDYRTQQAIFGSPGGGQEGDHCPGPERSPGKELRSIERHYSPQASRRWHQLYEAGELCQPARGQTLGKERSV